jgi:hypothetical protein
MEPIKAIHIVPTGNMLEVDKRYNKGLNMLLTHLVLNCPAYEASALALPGIKFLDNSFFELGYSLKPSALIEAASRITNVNTTNSNTVLICPDGTMDGMKEFIQAGYRVMCIPKSPAQFKDFMFDNRIDFVGVSEEHLAYRHCPGARYELFRDHLDEMMPKKKIHLLGGTDSVWELGLLHPFRDHIYSWDSSAVGQQSKLGHKLNDMKRKDITSVNFDDPIDITSELFLHNMNFVNNLLGAYNEE